MTLPKIVNNHLEYNLPMKASDVMSVQVVAAKDNVML
jgi:hypothetical protein